MSANNYADTFQALAIEFHKASKSGDKSSADRIMADMMSLHRKHKARIISDTSTR